MIGKEDGVTRRDAVHCDTKCVINSPNNRRRGEPIVTGRSAFFFFLNVAKVFVHRKQSILAFYAMDLAYLALEHVLLDEQVR